MPSPAADRTLLGLPLRDALLVLVVALTIAVAIAAFAARILGAPEVGAASLERFSTDDSSVPVSTLGGTPDDYKTRDR